MLQGLNARSLVLPAALALAVLGLLAGDLAIRTATRPEPPPPPVVTVVQPTPDVIVAIRDLARLQTAEYHVERVIDLKDRQQRLFGLIESEDAILLVAAGDVTAGIDLATMEAADVQVDPGAGTAVLTLPAPQVLSTRLDNDRTYVHSRVTDTLAQRSETLETRARQIAEETLTEAAISGGILDRAGANAERTLRVLVESLGYRQVEIRWHE